MAKEGFSINGGTIGPLPQDSATKLKMILAAIPTKGERSDGELTIYEFMNRHPCSLDDATKLQEAYLAIAPGCTHPLAICSSILNLNKEPLLTLMERLNRISKEKQRLKPI